jgi:tetratricopeptide (TPR) repeat protein
VTTRAGRWGARLAAAAILSAAALTGRADTSLPRLLDALELREHDGVFDVSVRFSTPVRYIRHAPADAGDTLQIQVAPVSLDPGDATFLSRRESLAAPPGWPVPLIEVVYEGRQDGRFLVARFSRKVAFSVRPGRDFRSLLITVTPIAGEFTPSEVAPLPGSDAAGLAHSDELLANGKRALADGDLDEAIRVFTKITTLPEHENSAEAKELLGVTRERKGQIAHAKAEYEEYLRWYPDGEGAARVRQRLDALLTANAKLPQKTAAQPEPTPYVDVDWFGSVGTQYRHEDLIDTVMGNTRLDSSLVSDLTLSARARSDAWSVRSLATGSYRYDFLPGGDATQARITAAYVDAAQRGGPWSGTFGRQPGNTAGMPSRLDGARLSRQLGDWRVSLRGGLPVELSTSDHIDSSRYLYGVSLDYGRSVENGPHAGHVDAQLFGMQQRAGAFVDRTGVGAELRYADDELFLASYGDYDLAFHALNTALLTGNWAFSPDTSVNLFVDYRYSPLLVTTNALQGQTLTDLSDLGKIYGASGLRGLARDRTPRAFTSSVGGSHQLTGHTQLALDVSVAKLGGTPSSGGVEGTPASGWETSYYPQLISSSFFTDGDVATLGVRYFDGSASDTISLIAAERWPVTPAFRLLPRLRIDWRNRSGRDEFAPTPDQIENDPVAAAAAARARNGSLTVRPYLGFDWRLWKITLNGEAGVEWTNASFDPAAGDQLDWSVALGIRYDF